MTYVTLFFSSLVFIAMRAFQQLNVQHHRYAWVPPVTAIMAVCEVLTVTAIIKASSLEFNYVTHHKDLCFEPFGKA